MAAPSQVSAVGRTPYKSRRQWLDALTAQLKQERDLYLPLYRELADFIKPKRYRNSTSDNQKAAQRSSKIIASTATRSANTLASGMMSGVTNPAQPWFRLTTTIPELAEQSSVKEWLHEVTERMETMFLRSNLYQELPILYGDMGVFATGAMSMLEHPEHGMRFQTFPVGTYSIGNDADRRVRVFSREFSLSVRQLLQWFGQYDRDGTITNWDCFSPSVQSAAKDGQMERRFDVCHVICPNDRYDPSMALSKYKKYYSVYYERGSSTDAGQATPTSYQGGKQNPGETFLREEGFDEFPIVAGRWEVVGEDAYGSDSPGITSLGDVKQLQLGAKRRAQAVDKLVDPPMQGAPELMNTPLSLLPGEVTFVTQGPNAGLRPIYEIDPKLDHLLQLQQETQRQIEQNFFTDMFLMWSQTDRRDITATEVMERRDEKLIVLGPVLGRINDDILDPLIDRAFAILVRRGEIPPAPPELQGQPLRVEYVSIMASAQKATGLGAIQRTAQFVVELATSNPEVLDKVDLDQLVDEFATASGVPPKIIRDDATVAEIRKQRQQAQASAQQAETLKNLSQGAKNLAQSPMDQPNALTAITGGVQNAA
jgi:hypothetical protein